MCSKKDLTESAEAAVQWLQSPFVLASRAHSSLLKLDVEEKFRLSQVSRTLGPNQREPFAKKIRFSSDGVDCQKYS